MVKLILYNFSLILHFFSGLLGVKLHDSFNEENLLIDAIQLIINTFSKFLDYPPLFWSESISVLNCSSTEPWSYGKDVYRYMLLFYFCLYTKYCFFSAFVNTSVNQGVTGDIEFNENGDRIESLYEIINIQHGQPKVVGIYRSNTVSLNKAKFI
jgi:hypothetical protein